MVRAALLALMLSGCALMPERTIHTQEPLPVPERPLLPTVTADDWRCLCEGEADRLLDVGAPWASALYARLAVGACLEPDKYKDLAERDAALRGHISRLEQIIETTHE